MTNMAIIMASCGIVGAGILGYCGKFILSYDENNSEKTPKAMQEISPKKNYTVSQEQIMNEQGVTLELVCKLWAANQPQQPRTIKFTTLSQLWRSPNNEQDQKKYYVHFIC